MRIDIETFKKSIHDLHVSKNISYREIERQSGVSNVSRIVSGEIRKPTAEPWQSLHDAFPNDIPEPIYIDGEKIYKNVVHHGSKTAYFSNGIALSHEEASLITALRKLGDNEAVEIYRILGGLAERLKVED